MNYRKSWALPVLLSGLVFVLVYVLSIIIGVSTFSIFDCGFRFLIGSFIGYVSWIILLKEF